MTKRAPTTPPLGLNRVLEYAALSGRFTPADALAAAEAPPSPAVSAEIASALAQACDTNPDESSAWVMHAPRRRQILVELEQSSQLDSAVARRRLGPMDPATADLLDALGGLGAFANDTLLSVIREAKDRGWVARVATALDRAGELAPAAPLLGAARNALAAMERELRRDELKQRGFFGRDAELEEIGKRLEALSQGRIVRAVFVSGLPGIGKSALLEEVIAREFDRHNSLTVRLDFDRAGLDVTEPQALTMEVARQLADRIGDRAQPLLDARLEAASTQETEASRGLRRSDFPEPLGVAIGNAVAASGRPVLAVVDTFEALQARGLTHADQLFEWLDWLHGLGLAPLRVVVAGRAPPPASLARSLGDPVDLGGLLDEPARKFLDRLDVPEQAMQMVLDCAAGNPLALRLAATIVRENGIDALPQGKPDPRITAALLYRILLSRIDDENLRRLAHPGLIVRRISAELLREVIAPAADMLVDKSQAEDLFDALSRQHWLVEQDPHDSAFVRHRSDMRGVLLPLLYQSERALCGKIDAAATRWFGKRKDQASALDALYHRLQLLRRSPARPAVPEALARRFDLITIAELPARAQVLIRQAAGESATAFGLAPDGSLGEDLLASELVAIIARGDWSEGRHLVERVRETASIDPLGRLADAVRALWWRSGQWHDALWLLREHDRLGGEDTELYRLPPPFAVARIEMRGEFGPATSLLRETARWDDLPRSAFQASRIALQGGWAFRLQASDPAIRARFVLEGGADPIEATMERWLGSPDASVAGDALKHAQDLLNSLHIRLDYPLPSWVESQMLASLTPYPELVVNLAQGDRRIFDHARAAVDSLIVGPHSPLGLADCVSNSAAAVDQHDPIAAIASAGLFSEWVEALAFVLRNANLRTVARAAESWRRTVAGQWRYGRPPHPWPRRPLDEVLNARIERHLDSHDPTALAFTQLAAWVPHVGSGEDVWRLVARRAQGALAAASRETSAFNAAQLLLRFRVPAAFVPPIVTLLRDPKSLPEEWNHG